MTCKRTRHDQAICDTMVESAVGHLVPNMCGGCACIEIVEAAIRQLKGKGVPNNVIAAGLGQALANVLDVPVAVHIDETEETEETEDAPQMDPDLRRMFEAAGFIVMDADETGYSPRRDPKKVN